MMVCPKERDERSTLKKTNVQIATNTIPRVLGCEISTKLNTAVTNSALIL
jgi:hypothetical protein